MGKRADRIREAAKRVPKKREVSLARFWGRVLKKLAIYTVFILYICLGLFAAFTWGSTTLFRSLEPEAMLVRLDHYRNRGKFDEAVRLFAVQKPERAQEVINLLVPRADILEPVFYLQISRQYMQLGNPDEALFWHMLGFFRLRFDAVRCDGHKNFQAVDVYMTLHSPMALAEYVESNPQRAEEIFRTVMEWDAKNPPQTSPKYFCRLARFMVYGGGDYTGQVIEQDLWPVLYKAFRAEAENGFIQDLRRMAEETPGILMQMNTGTGMPSPQEQPQEESGGEDKAEPEAVPEDAEP